MNTAAPASASARLTLLSSILGPDFPRALERQKALGITFLDLKDGLWGKTIESLSGEEAARAAALIGEYGFGVHCFSTSIGHAPFTSDTTETAFRSRYEPALENAISVARVLRPRVIRLLAPRLAPLPGETTVARLLREFPWVINVYRDWADRITASARGGVLVENEATGCALASVADVLQFFDALDRPAVRYTWDVQNLWQNGVFPTLDVYQQLKPLMGALHVKGGRTGANGETLETASSLEEASWPVLAITRAAILDGVAPFICLNPSHGEKPPGWDTWEIAQRDAAFLRREIKEIV